jgi:hypothetical protein
MSNQQVTIPEPLNPGDTLTITVGKPIAPTITSVAVSGPSVVAESATAQFTAKVTGTGNFDPSVKWTCSDGIISSTGLFTAPAKAETVMVTATSVQDPTKSNTQPVQITASGNTIQIRPTGGVDNQNWLTQFAAAIAQGKIAEIMPGTYNLQPFTFDSSLNGLHVQVDPLTVFEDTPTGWGHYDRMFTFKDGNNTRFIGAGSALCTITMPNRWAANKADPNEGTNQYNHAICFDGCNGAQATGFGIVKAGGDGVNFNSGTNIAVDDITVKQSIRQGFSVTGGCTNVTIGTIEAEQNNNSGFDFEPNPGSSDLTGWRIGSLTTKNNPGGGLSFGMFNIGGGKKVDVVVNSFDSESDQQNGISFWNNNSGVGTNPTGQCVVNKYTVNNSQYDGTYGRKSTDGWTMILNNGTITNPNRGGRDPHYGSNAALGVAVDGGETGTPGGVQWNGVTITGGNGCMDLDGAAVTTVKGTCNGKAISYP